MVTVLHYGDERTHPLIIAPKVDCSRYIVSTKYTKSSIQYKRSQDILALGQVIVDVGIYIGGGIFRILTGTSTTMVLPMVARTGTIIPWVVSHIAHRCHRQPTCIMTQYVLPRYQETIGMVNHVLKDGVEIVGGTTTPTRIVFHVLKVTSMIDLLQYIQQ